MVYQCKYILKQCKAFGDEEFNYNDKNFRLYNVHNPNKFVCLKKHTSEANILLNSLVQDGFLEKSQFGFKNTVKSIHYFQLNLRKFCLFILKSVLVPIILSIITTLITLYIAGQ